ncbi:MAG: thiol:disulfide interchange protein DsbA [Burkholderiaceae bacterium]
MHHNYNTATASRRSFVHKLLATFGFGLGMHLGLTATQVHATPAAPVNGTEYRTLEKAQSTDATGKKVEVTEFFWYSCPHCSAFEPALEDWVKKQGDNISFKRVPVAFRESFQPQQRLYYALEAMGKVDDLQKKIFRAIHTERKNLDSDAQIADFIASQGIDRKKFVDAYGSFGVQAKLKRAMQLQDAYRVDGVPLVAIDGRFLTSPSIVGASLGSQPEAVLQSATLQVMDWLVAKAAKDRKVAGAQTAPSTARK